MKKDKKNEEIIDSYDYLTNAASTTDCTGLMPTPAYTEDQREAYDAIFHVIGNSNHMKRSAGMRRGACNEDVATQPRLAHESVKTDSFSKTTPLNPKNEED